MRTLKIEEILPYLPYKTLCYYSGIDAQSESVVNKVGEVKWIAVFKEYWKVYAGKHPGHLKTFYKGEKCKLLLIPLSEVDTTKLIDYLHGDMTDNIQKWIYHFDSKPLRRPKLILQAPYSVMEWFFKNHFDVFSLIDDHLALDKRKILKDEKGKKRFEVRAGCDNHC